MTLIMRKGGLAKYIPVEEESDQHISHFAFQNNKKDEECYDSKRKKMMMKKEIEDKIRLIPVKPVWQRSRCYRFEDWYSVYANYIDEMFETLKSYNEYLYRNGYDQKYNERDLYNRLVDYMYQTSENVRTNYHFLD